MPNARSPHHRSVKNVTTPDLLEEPLRAAFELGRRSWPGVELDPAVFSAFARAAGLVPGADGAGDALLAYACASGVASAIALFEQHMVPVAARAIARVQRSEDLADEALQQFRLKFLVGPPPALARYRGRSPLRAWLRVSAARVAIDGLRARRADERPLDALADRLMAGGLDPELCLLVESTRDVLRRALAGAIAQLSTRERNLLRMHFEHGLSIDRLAIPAGVHRATVARWLKDARERITAIVLRELGQRHPELGRSSLDSLLRAVRGQLEISVSSLFAERRDDRSAPGPA